MPEAFAVFLVFVVAVASYVGARRQASNPSNQSAKAELMRLRQQQAWLAGRLRQGWRENWDQQMLARLTDELESTEAQLAKATPAVRHAA